MAQYIAKRAWQTNHGRGQSLNLEHADVVILDPNSSHELVQRLVTNSAWKVRFKATDLVIFVRSVS